MIVRLQMKVSGEWVKVLGDYSLPPGTEWHESTLWDWQEECIFRTKIYSRLGEGGVTGVGAVSNSLND